MTAASLLGLMYSYGKGDDLIQLIHDVIPHYFGIFGELPTIVAVHPGTVIPNWITEIDIVERKFIRPGFILVGKFEKET